MRPTRPLLAHAPATPLDTVASSTVPVAALAVIEWCIFDGHMHKDVVDMYNAAGYGSVATKHGISWQLRRWGPTWYEEQKAVRPWELYTRIEREELKKNGLGSDDFRFVHPRDLDIAGGVVQVQGKPRGEREMRREKARRRGKLATKSVDTIQDDIVSRQSSRHQASTSSSPIARLSLQIPLFSPTSKVPPPHIPENLKIAIKAKREEWLDVNKAGEACKADPVEEELEDLERQAMGVSFYGFLGWKFGEEAVEAAMN